MITNQQIQMLSATSQSINSCGLGTMSYTVVKIRDRQWQNHHILQHQVHSFPICSTYTEFQQLLNPLLRKPSMYHFQVCSVQSKRQHGTTLPWQQLPSKIEIPFIELHVLIGMDSKGDLLRDNHDQCSILEPQVTHICQ